MSFSSRKLTQKKQKPQPDHRERNGRRMQDLRESHSTVKSNHEREKQLNNYLFEQIGENFMEDAERNISKAVTNINIHGNSSLESTTELPNPFLSSRRRNRRHSTAQKLKDNSDYPKMTRQISNPLFSHEYSESEASRLPTASLQRPTSSTFKTMQDKTNILAENSAIVNKLREEQQSLKQIEDKKEAEKSTNSKVGPETKKSSTTEDFGAQSTSKFPVNSKTRTANQFAQPETHTVENDEDLRQYKYLEGAFASLKSFTEQLMGMGETNLIFSFVTGEEEAGTVSPSTDSENAPNVPENLELTAFQQFADQMPIEQEVQLVNQYVLHGGVGEDLRELQPDDFFI